MVIVIIWCLGRVAPKISVDATHKHSHTGDSTTFSCAVKEGIPKPVLFWKTSLGYRVPKHYVKELDDGTTVLVFRKVYKRLEGQYTCVGLNKAGKVEQAVMLTVKGRMNFIILLSTACWVRSRSIKYNFLLWLLWLLTGDPKLSLYPAGDYDVTTGDQVNISCSGSGIPNPAISFVFPINVTRDDVTRTQQNGLHKIEFIANKRLSGRYSCIGVNRYGVKKAWINVIGKHNHILMRDKCCSATKDIKWFKTVESNLL